MIGVGEMENTLMFPIPCTFFIADVSGALRIGSVVCILFGFINCEILTIPFTGIEPTLYFFGC